VSTTSNNGEHLPVPGSAYPKPLCRAIRLRLLLATGEPITPELASELGMGVYDNSDSEQPPLMGVAIDCPACDVLVAGNVDPAGHITGIGPIADRPGFEVCRTSAGKTVMDRLQRPV
jgi:hypothetical protein